MRNENYNLAIENTIKAKKLLIQDGSLPFAQFTNIDLAVFMALNGAPDEAMVTLLETEKYIFENPTAASTMFYHVQVAKIAIMKCSGLNEAEPIKEEITNHAHHNQKGALQIFLDIVERLECRRDNADLE
jgi:hypothetical protein